MVFERLRFGCVYLQFLMLGSAAAPRTHPSMTHRNLNVPDPECKTHRAIYTLNPRGLECCNPPNTSDSSSDLSCHFPVRTHQGHLLRPRGDTVRNEQYSAAFACVRACAHCTRIWFVIASGSGRVVGV